VESSAPDAWGWLDPGPGQIRDSNRAMLLAAAAAAGAVTRDLGIALDTKVPTPHTAMEKLRIVILGFGTW
jgi:molybdopterin biosynthesis enzyme